MEMRDSRGTLSESSENYWPAELQPVTMEFILAQMARLTVVFGEPKNRSEQQMELLAAEWLQALEGFTQRSIMAAVTKAISLTEFWPTPALVQRCAREINSDRPKYEPRWSSASESDTRSESSKARVARMVSILKKHQRSGSETPFGDTANDPEYRAIIAEYQQTLSA